MSLRHTNTPNEYIYTEMKEINNLNVEITTSSYYPIPWTSSIQDRPQDYYEKQSRIIRYYKEDIDRNNNPIRKKIEIEIPKVAIGLNRERVITVKVDGTSIVFNDNDSMLDMNHTFNIRDVNLLMQIVRNCYPSNNNPSLLQTITPFIHLPGVRGDEDYTFNRDNNSDICKMLFPYIKEMQHLNNQSVVRELIIPVVTKGLPHHWNFGVFTIDKNNIPSLTYIDSGNMFEKYDYNTFLYYMHDYKHKILPAINLLLNLFHYAEIKTIAYCKAKQFSQEGCGIAMSLTIKKILEGHYPEMICNSDSKPQDIPPINIIRQLSSSVTIEADAIMRAELAFKIKARESIIANQDFDPTHVKIKSLNCSEILNHPHTLKTKAREAFSFFQPLHSSKVFTKLGEEAPVSPQLKQ